MSLLIASFLAGVLTVAAPCVLPLLPVIIGGTAARETGRPRSWRRPVVIAASLAVSIVIFTLLLRATTALLGVPTMVWQAISGVIIAVLGVHFLAPTIWDRLSGRFNLTGRSGQLLAAGQRREGLAGDITLGAALGPAFNSCSPTYALIVAAILPRSFGEGLAALFAYAIGLAAALLLLAFAGRGLASRLGWLANPHGRFRRGVGILLIVVGVAVTFGFDRDLQAAILERGWYDPIANFEQRLGL